MGHLKGTAEEILESRGAVVTENHFVYKAGDHGSAYINKDALAPHVHDLKLLAGLIADKIISWGIEATIAPPMGAIKLGDRVAEALSIRTSKSVMAIYAEKNDTSVYRPNRGSTTVDLVVRNSNNHGSKHLDLWMPEGSEIIIRRPGLVIKRGQDHLIQGKRVGIIEDILNTGTSARQAVVAARVCGADVVGVAAICNRGSVSGYTLDVSQVVSLLDVAIERYPASECRLCALGVPINTELGHGKDFVATRPRRHGWIDG